MSEQKKQNFLQGTALLAMATVIVKLVGALYKVPLNAIIGEKGFGYFSTAYEIYNILLMISTAGLPVAMSRMISQASSLGHYNQVRRVYATARGIFLGLGISGSLLMTVFCRQLAAFQRQPDAWAAIGCLGPCVLLICVMSIFRGFFQGQSNMIPTAVSQVLEVVTKLIVGMAAALAFLKATADISLAAGGAILGVTASCPQELLPHRPGAAENCGAHHRQLHYFVHYHLPVQQDLYGQTFKLRHHPGCGGHHAGRACNDPDHL